MLPIPPWSARGPQLAQSRSTLPGQVQPTLANNTQHNPSLSDDGLRIAFSCYASNLLPGVDGMHVYVRSYAGVPGVALPVPSQGVWGLSVLVAGVAGLGMIGLMGTAGIRRWL